MIERARYSFLLLVAVLAFSSSAHADDAADAKSHYQKATAHYAVGEYRDAAAEYEAAYKAKQDPALLYNAAQSHRLANDNQKALLLYRNIVKLYPTSKYAVESKDRIEKLEQAIATTQSPPNQPAPVELGKAPPAGAPPAAAAPVQPLSPSVTGAPPPSAPPPVANGGGPAATVTATAPPPSSAEGSPVYTKWWFWTIVGAAVVGGTVAIIAASSSTTPWNNVSNVNGSVR
ncbi:MAG TPA: tetratricopeptide repeat protein [Polyangia bacterium]|jgi:hypothetical protein|nr:tetratricopeptide repeat protein [Polyangia bacterium]